MTRFLLLLALMCENVNASDMPPFKISDPMCNTGFTVAMRYDERNSAGTITKSVWVRKCVRVPRIVYGRKV